MIPNTFSIRFFIRNERIDKDGFAPIYCKVTINGENLNLSLNRKIRLKDWATDKAKSNTPLSKAINIDIEAFKSRAYLAHSHILATNQILNASVFKKEFLGEKDEIKTPTLLETAKEHNQNFEKMLGIKYSQGSYKNYKTTLKYLIEFVPIYKNKKDTPLKDVNYKFCEAFFTFLTTEKTCKQNGANKQIQRLKKIINYAIKQGYIQTNPMASFSLEFTPVNKVALTMHELDNIAGLKLNRKVLINVRDVFLLQCYTGLSYSDVKNLRRSDITLIFKNEPWIKMMRQKTKISFSVPLLPQAFTIIDKYMEMQNGDNAFMNVISNQKMNENLKIIQELADISKNLTTHLARHTFATTITLGNGVPIETVSRMLGHTKLATTQIYAKVLDNKIEEDMNILKNKFRKKNGEEIQE